MEKFKDIIHDFSDVFIALIIVALMIGVVALNLGDWFDKDATVSAINTTPVTEEGPTEKSQLPEPTEEDEKDEKDEKDETAEEEVEETEEKPEKEPEREPIEVIIVDNKTITIPNGTPGIGIAKILLENGLVENAQDFVNTAEDLGLALTLKSGTFDIPVNATLEEMVKIIARRN